MPISPMCERNTTKIPQSQVGFLKYVVMPMYQAMEFVCPEVEETGSACLKRNLGHWERESIYSKICVI